MWRILKSFTWGASHKQIIKIIMWTIHSSNKDKTCSSIRKFHTSAEEHPPLIYVNSFASVSKTTKSLGVYIDNNFEFNAHVNHIHKSWFLKLKSLYKFNNQLFQKRQTLIG